MTVFFFPVCSFVFCFILFGQALPLFVYEVVPNTVMYQYTLSDKMHTISELVELAEYNALHRLQFIDQNTRNVMHSIQFMQYNAEITILTNSSWPQFIVNNVQDTMSEYNACNLIYIIKCMESTFITLNQVHKTNAKNLVIQVIYHSSTIFPTLNAFNKYLSGSHDCQTFNVCP